MSSIKRLVIDNFQSHQHTEVEFGSGLNVVVGPSDFGKSALVRALRWVLYNEPRGANFIRAGAKVCKVKVEMDEGAIVTRLRSTTGKNQFDRRRPKKAKKTLNKKIRPIIIAISTNPHGGRKRG
jgi:exonuclease SbcC